MRAFVLLRISCIMIMVFEAIFICLWYAAPFCGHNSIIWYKAK